MAFDCNICYPTYNDLHDAAVDFVYAAELRCSDGIPRIDAVIGLSRGGVFPANIISHYLEDVKMVVIDYSSSRGKGDNVDLHTNEIPKMDYDRILIVDDIIDSGYTMEEIFDTLSMRGHDIKTFSYFYKETSVFEPDHYTWHLPQNSPWVVFPWERRSS